MAMNLTSKLDQAKAGFIFRYFADRTHSSDGHGRWYSAIFECTPTWDDSLDFAVSFGEAFPGRKRDPNHNLASARLSKIMKMLADDGWLHRHRLGNQKDQHGDPSWQYTYQLQPWLINDLKNGITTPEEAAKEWGGHDLTSGTTPSGTTHSGAESGIGLQGN